jgi:uncharacterized membrane protein YfcA
MFKDELREIGFILGLGFRFVLYITSEQPRVSTAGFFLIILFYFIYLLKHNSRTHLQPRWHPQVKNCKFFSKPRTS